MIFLSFGLLGLHRHKRDGLRLPSVLQLTDRLNHGCLDFWRHGPDACDDGHGILHGVVKVVQVTHPLVGVAAELAARRHDAPVTAVEVLALHDGWKGQPVAPPRTNASERALVQGERRRRLARAGGGAAHPRHGVNALASAEPLEALVRGVEPLLQLVHLVLVACFPSVEALHFLLELGHFLLQLLLRLVDALHQAARRHGGLRS
mmetsp:Transcript_35180/g.109828  ORF Transcript_35180/g.109828 Transcript_35180/m.109828 type:complete len:205 (-) Transcript_35180:356-970(-)